MFTCEVSVPDTIEEIVSLMTAASLVIGCDRAYSFGPRRRGAPQIDTMRMTPS
jgi:hypothetical protein